MIDLKKNSSICSLLMMIGGLMGVLSLFLVWLDVNGSTLTGWSILFGNYNTFLSLVGYSNFYMLYVPYIAFTFSFYGFVSGLMLLRRSRSNGGTGSAIAGIVVLVTAVLFSTYSRTVTSTFTMSIADYLSTGFYLAVAAGILMFVFGVLREVFHRAEKKANKR